MAKSGGKSDGKWEKMAKSSKSKEKWGKVRKSGEKWGKVIKVVKNNQKKLKSCEKW